MTDIQELLKRNSHIFKTIANECSWYDRDQSNYRSNIKKFDNDDLTLLVHIERAYLSKKDRDARLIITVLRVQELVVKGFERSIAEERAFVAAVLSSIHEANPNTVTAIDTDATQINDFNTLAQSIDFKLLANVLDYDWYIREKPLNTFRDKCLRGVVRVKQGTINVAPYVLSVVIYAFIVAAFLALATATVYFTWQYMQMHFPHPFK